MSDDLLHKKYPRKFKIQHMNLQDGLFANFNTKRFVSGVGWSKEKV